MFTCTTFIKPRLLTDHKGKYAGFEEKDKTDLCSLLFDALTIQPFDPVERLVVQLLEVGVPVTIKDEVTSIFLYHVTSFL